MTWTAAPGRDVLGYNIYRARSSAGPYSFLNAADGNSYLDRDVKSGDTYYYKVAEVNIEGTESRSAMVASAELTTGRATSALKPPIPIASR